jgi:hypothetical protein
MRDMGTMASSSVPMMFPIANLHGSFRGGRGRGWKSNLGVSNWHPQEVVTFQQALCQPITLCHSLLSLLCLGFIQRMCLYIKPKKKYPLVLPKVTLHMNTQFLLQYKTLVHLYFFLPFHILQCV